MPPRRGRDRFHRVLMDEEATSTLHALPLQGDFPVPLEFSIPPIPQARFFPPMTLEAFQAFTTYWYAQAHGQFFVPPMAPFVPP